MSITLCVMTLNEIDSIKVIMLGDESKRIAGERKLQIIRWGLAFLYQIIVECFNSPIKPQLVTNDPSR